MSTFRISVEVELPDVDGIEALWDQPGLLEEVLNTPELWKALEVDDLMVSTVQPVSAT